MAKETFKHTERINGTDFGFNIELLTNSTHEFTYEAIMAATEPHALFDLVTKKGIEHHDFQVDTLLPALVKALRLKGYTVEDARIYSIGEKFSKGSVSLTAQVDVVERKG
jgi:hypothetical protein